MEANFPDWKPVVVKLEPDFSLEDDLVTDSHCPASHVDGSHRVPSAMFVDPIPASPERICLNLADGLPARPKSTSSTSQEVKIKKEVEDETPSPDHLMDDCHENSAQTAPSEYHSVFFSEKITIKSEDNVIEGNNIVVEEPLLHDFVKTNKGRVEDPFHDVGCNVSTVATPSTIPGTKTVSSVAGFEESMDNASESSATCNETTPYLNFEFVKVEIVSDNDDVETQTECEPTLNQHAALHEEVLSRPKFKSIECTRVTDRNVAMDNDECVTTHVYDQASAGSSVSLVSSFDQSSMSREKQRSRQSIKQSVSCKLFTAQSQRNVDLKKKSESPSDGRPFSCDQCTAKFSRKTNLRRHSLTHSGEKAFSCDQCSAKFSLKSTLKTHSLIHSGEKAFFCNQCPAKFRQIGHLKTHSLTHSGEKAFSCDQCPAKFSQKGDLKRHVFSHSGEKPFSCGQCPAIFSQRSNLKAHSLIHSREKVFSCDQCPEKFSLKSDHQRHSLTHSGKKVFSCDQCPAVFNVKSSLKTHLLVHSDERAFSCDQCPAKFRRKCHLKTHSFIHSGEKAFSCDLCSAKFELKSSLKKHSRIHSC